MMHDFGDTMIEKLPGLDKTHLREAFVSDKTSHKVAAQSVRKAFTLIELLVVIAIISIIASILFPVFARARENARRASCMSNMKQIGLGIFQYAQDYDEKFPFNGSEYPSTPAKLPELLDSYLKSTQIFKCPSDMSAKGSLSNYLATGSLATTTTYPMSYYYHFCFYHVFTQFDGPQSALGNQPNDLFTRPKAVSMALVAYPTQKAMLDCVLSDDGLLDTTGKTYPPHRPGFILSLYADGHVKNASFSNFTGNAEFGYVPYGSSATVYYNADWTRWGVQADDVANGTGGKDLNG